MRTDHRTTNDNQESDVDTLLELEICLTEEDIGA